MGVVFNPKMGREYPPNIFYPKKLVYNLWEGFQVPDTKGKWKLMRKHVWAILCNKDKAKFKYVMRWLAWSIQNPSERAEVALVIKGKQGAGKGILFTQFKHIFGKHYMTISSSDHLTGKFNEHLRQAVFLFADEAYDPKDRESESRLKQLITEPDIPIEGKFVNTILAKNRLHIVMATNNDRVIIAGEDTRRFFINETTNTYAMGQGKNNKERTAYFTPIWKEMESGGRSAMLYDLKRINLGDWHPRSDIPETAEMKKQRRLQFNPITAVLEYLEKGEIPFDSLEPKVGGQYEVKSSILEKHMRDTIPSLKDARIIGWRRVLDILEGIGCKRRRKTEGSFVCLDELHILQEKWDNNHPGYQGEWPKGKANWILIKNMF